MNIGQARAYFLKIVYFLNLFTSFEKQKIWKGMIIARSIFTLDGRFQLFLSAFDLSVTVVPLKVAIGLEQNNFWLLKKIKNAHLPDLTH